MPPGPSSSTPGVDQSVARHRRVGGDDAGEPEFDGQVGDLVDVGVGQVRRDLHQHWRRGLRPDRGQDGAQRLHGLQVAQARRVRRADVDHQERGQRADQACALGVVGDGVLGRGHLGLADVHPDRHVGGVPGQPQREFARSVIVEPHPVEQGLVVGQPEHPRLRIAGLGLRGHRADLGVAETQRAPGVQARAVLVEPGGQADRAGKPDAEHRALQHRIRRCQPPGQAAAQRAEVRWPCAGTANTQVWMRSGGDQEQHPAQRVVDHAVPATTSPADRRQPVGSGLLAAQQNPSAAVGVQADPGQLPTAVLRLDRQPRRGGQPRHVGWQPQRHPLVLVGQVGFPSGGHPATLDRRHGCARPRRSPARPLPSPTPRTGCRCRRRRPGSSVAARFDNAPSPRGFRWPDRNQRRCSSRSLTPRPARSNPRQPVRRAGHRVALAQHQRVRAEHQQLVAAGVGDQHPARGIGGDRGGAFAGAQRVLGLACPTRRRWSPTSGRDPARRPCRLVRQGHPRGRRSAVGRLTAVSEPRVYTAPSALPRTTLPSARLRDRGEVDVLRIVDVHPASTAPRATSTRK